MPHNIMPIKYIVNKLWIIFQKWSNWHWCCKM